VYQYQCAFYIYFISVGLEHLPWLLGITVHVATADTMAPHAVPKHSTA